MLLVQQLAEQVVPEHRPGHVLSHHPDLGLGSSSFLSIFFLLGRGPVGAGISRGSRTICLGGCPQAASLEVDLHQHVVPFIF